MKKITTLLLGILLLWSCSSSDKTQSEISDVNIKDLEASIPSEMIGKPVEKFNDKLDELLTLEIAASALNLPPGEAEKDYEQTLKNPLYHTIFYKWDNGRTQMLSLPNGMEFEVPAEDMVSLSWLQHTSSEQFKNTYREPTKEELEAFNQILGEETKKMDLSDDLTETVKSDLGGGLASNLEFTDVSGVGDIARWNAKTNELPVYYKGISFIIQVESGKGTEMDKNLAAKVAKEVVKKL